MVARETRAVEEESGKRLTLISAVIIAIIAYLIILSVVIVPLQGGTISSTDILQMISERVPHTTPHPVYPSRALGI